MANGWWWWRIPPSPVMASSCPSLAASAFNAFEILLSKSVTMATTAFGSPPNTPSAEINCQIDVRYDTYSCDDCGAVLINMLDVVRLILIECDGVMMLTFFYISLHRAWFYCDGSRWYIWCRSLWCKMPSTRVRRCIKPAMHDHHHIPHHHHTLNHDNEFGTMPVFCRPQWGVKCSFQPYRVLSWWNHWTPSPLSRHARLICCPSAIIIRL